MQKKGKTTEDLELLGEYSAFHFAMNTPSGNRMMSNDVPSMKLKYIRLYLCFSNHNPLSTFLCLKAES